MFLVPVLFFTHPTGLGLRKNIFFYHILSLQRGFIVSTDRVHLLLLSLLFLFYLVFIFQGNWQQFILSTLVTTEKTIFGSQRNTFLKKTQSLWVKMIQLQGRTATCHVNTMETKVLICDLSIQPTVCQRSDSRVALEMCLAVFVFNPSIICTAHPFAHQFVKLDTYGHIYPPLPVFMPMSRSITSLYHIFYIWLR